MSTRPPVWHSGSSRSCAPRSRSARAASRRRGTAARAGCGRGTCARRRRPAPAARARGRARRCIAAARRSTSSSLEVGGERVRRELRRVQDLVRPRAADAGDRPLVAQQRVEAVRLALRRIAASVGRVEPERLGAEVGELRRGGLRREQPDAGALLPCVLGEDELRAAGELEPERGRLRAACRRRGASSAGRRSSGGRAGRARRRRWGRGAACRAARRRGSAVPRARRAAGRTSSASRCARGRPSRRERGRHGVVQCAPPRLHLGQLRHPPRR